MAQEEKSVSGCLVHSSKTPLSCNSPVIQLLPNLQPKDKPTQHLSVYTVFSLYSRDITDFLLQYVQRRKKIFLSETVGCLQNNDRHIAAWAPHEH